MKFVKVCPSLSARRAWIEIAPGCDSKDAHSVALRKESVDRNEQLALKMMKNTESLSARRAWIEIPLIVGFPGVLGSLSARRAWIEIVTLSRFGTLKQCRSPQGERG